MAAEDRDDPAVDPWQGTPPPGEEARPGGDDDATAIRDTPPTVGPSGTAIMPPVPGSGSGAAPPEAPRWEGRAAVPAPQMHEQPEPWAEPPRSVVVPVLVTICVMLLLGVLALGAWLILANRPGPTSPELPGSSGPASSSSPPTSPTPSPSPSPSVSPSPSPAPSESPPPSPSESPPPSPSAS